MVAHKVGIGKILGIALAVIVALGVLGSMGGGNRPEYSAESASNQQSTEAAAESSEAGEAATEEAPAEQAEPAAKYEITEEAVDTSNPYSTKITGKLTNNSGRDVGYIQVEYVIYDAEGNQVGTGWANTNNLKAGGTWKYEAITMVAPEDFASYELAGVTGF